MSNSQRLLKVNIMILHQRFLGVATSSNVDYSWSHGNIPTALPQTCNEHSDQYLEHLI